MRWRSPRAGIEHLIEAGDLEGLLRRAGELHGHYCPYLAYGVVAGYTAVRMLGVRSVGMEEVLAIVETNNCFSDGIQAVTGCTFGNNALIYLDLGKTAFTLARRSGEAVRLALNPEFEESRRAERPELRELWRRIVAEREEVSNEERVRFMELMEEEAFDLIHRPASEMFIIKRMRIEAPDYAPIYASVRCHGCGELVMESRAGLRDGKPYCLSCLGAQHPILDGRGIYIGVWRPE